MSDFHDDDEGVADEVSLCRDLHYVGEKQVTTGGLDDCDRNVRHKKKKRRKKRFASLYITSYRTLEGVTSRL